MWTGFSAYLLLSLPCVYCAWHMEFKLGAKHATQQQQLQQQELGTVESQKAAAAGDVGSIGSTGSAYVKGTGTKQQQQQDDNTHDLDQCSVQELEQQRLLLHESSTLEQVDGQLQQSLQLQGPASHALQQQQLQPGQQLLQQHRLQVEGIQQQEQQLPCSTAISSAEDADACVLLLYSSNSPTASCNQASHNGLRQHHMQHTDRVEHAVDTDSSNSSSSKQQLDAGSLQIQQQQQQQVSHDFWQGLRQLLSSPAVIIFMWQATVMGFGIGACYGLMI
jgi:hypothetical protein